MLGDYVQSRVLCMRARHVQIVLASMQGRKVSPMQGRCYKRTTVECTNGHLLATAAVGEPHHRWLAGAPAVGGKGGSWTGGCNGQFTALVLAPA